MVIYAYTGFYKRKNSTLRPSGNAIEYNCYFKESCSIASPIFIIDGVNTTINYIKWNSGSWDRYYYVTDIILQNNNIYEVHCNIDYLATFKNDIGNTKAFIEYCADATNVYIPDARLTQVASNDIITSEGNPVYMTGSKYEYFLTAISTNNYGDPFSKIWRMSEGNLRALASLMYSPSLLQRLQNEFGNAGNCMVSLKKLPTNTNSLVDSSHENEVIKLGNVDMVDSGTDARGDILTKYVFKERLEVTIPFRYNNFLQLSPWTDLSLYLPFVGVVELSASDFMGAFQNKMVIEIVYSIYTRQVTYCIYRHMLPTDQMIGMYTGQMGYEIPVSSYQSNASGGITTAITGALATVGAVAGLVTGGASTVATVAAGVTGAASTITNATAKFLQHTPTMNGSFNGAGIEMIGVRPSIITNYHETIIDPDSNYGETIGKPFMDVDFIHNHSGYVKCVDASVNCDGFEQDKDMINAFLNTGFFYE